MKTRKMKLVFDELMEFGYEYNLIASTTMRHDPELEDRFDEITQKCVKYCTDFFSTPGQNFSIDHQRSTILRFCLLLGMGSTWLWKFRREEAKSKGLYECMAEPRTEYYMDEYIEDLVGIWYSPDSYEDMELMLMTSRMQRIIEKYFDLGKPQQLFEAARTIMQFGMQHEYTRLCREGGTLHCESEDGFNFAVLSSLLNQKEDSRKEELETLVNELVFYGKRSNLVHTAQKDPDSEFGRIANCYYTATDRNAVGAKVVLSPSGKSHNIIDIFPIFNSMRRYHLRIMAIRECEGGATAFIDASFTNCKNHVITFYDTDYLKNKKQYFVGQTYVFDLYGVALEASIIPEEQQTFKLEGDNAVGFNCKIGAETIYDDNGVPMPVVFNTANMHAFLQEDQNTPNLVDFAAPVNAVYDDVDYYGNNVHEVEIEMIYSSEDKDQSIPISIYLPANTIGQKPAKTDPIRGTVCLYGRMLSRIDINAPRSTELHTFDAKTKDGNCVFKHQCSPNEKGELLSDEEAVAFAKKIYFDMLGSSLDEWEGREDGAPDFIASRGRAVWVQPNTEYNAKWNFRLEKPANYMRLYHTKGLLPIIAYITLYDKEGNKCQWLKGGEYTAKIIYGSMLTGQKSELAIEHKQIALEDLTANAFKSGQSSILANYIHKDIDFRSRSFDDPIITREEFIRRFDDVSATLKRKYKESIEIIWPNEGPGIELKYPNGDVDRVYITAKNSLITSMRIEVVSKCRM